jgi:hypothetical protein
MPKVGFLFATVEGFVTIPLIGSRLVPSLRAGGRAAGAGSRRRVATRVAAHRHSAVSGPLAPVSGVKAGGSMLASRSTAMGDH